MALQIAVDAVDAIISGKIRSLDELRPHATKVVHWLKESLCRAHEDPELKQRVKRLLGAPRFAPNLVHLGLWAGLMEDCEMKALALGEDMQRYYVASDLGTVLGAAAVPNVYGTFRIGEGGLHEVVAAGSEDEGVRRQDCAMPRAFPQDTSCSQLWNERCFIHCIRMIAMGIDESFQTSVREVCKDAGGAFKTCMIKGFVRMSNKCVSYADHYGEAYPRPGLNIDVNRNACTFEKPGDLLSFISQMTAHPKFGSHPVRIKNMFLFCEERAKRQFFYRTVMINWLYSPGITYGELAEQAKGVWDTYYNFQRVPNYGDKDPAESWATWRRQIAVARAYLTAPAIQDRPVQFIVETQLLLRPYLVGRCKMHLLYKVFRADTPEALHGDFRTIDLEKRPFDKVQEDAYSSAKAFVAETDDVNCCHADRGGAPWLWTAAAQGHEMAVRELLRHPGVDPNKVREGAQTSPLYVASYHGHEGVVRLILGHPRTHVNRGKTDTSITPLVAAVQEGHEGVVKALLEADGIDVNAVTDQGVSPLLKACDQGREYVVEMLLNAEGIDAYVKLTGGVTCLSLAANHGNVHIVEMLVSHYRREIPNSCPHFPVRRCFSTDEHYRSAVLAWAQDLSNSPLPPDCSVCQSRL